MSKNYNLRTWAMLSTNVQADPPWQASPNPAHRLYSDVVASRPPSPVSGDREIPVVAVGIAYAPEVTAIEQANILPKNVSAFVSSSSAWKLG